MKLVPTAASLRREIVSMYAALHDVGASELEIVDDNGYENGERVGMRLLNDNQSVLWAGDVGTTCTEMRALHLMHVTLLKRCRRVAKLVSR